MRMQDPSGKKRNFPEDQINRRLEAGWIAIDEPVAVKARPSKKQIVVDEPIQLTMITEEQPTEE